MTYLLDTPQRVPADHSPMARLLPTRATTASPLITRNLADISGIDDIALDNWRPNDHSDPA
jgi:hypothetical protein